MRHRMLIILTKERASISSLVLVLVSTLPITLVIFLINDISYISKSQRTENQLTNVSESANPTESDQFVWSEKLQRWMLSLFKKETKTTSDKLKSRCIWPEDDCPGEDRIIDQLLLNRKNEHKVYKIFPPDANLKAYAQVGSDIDHVLEEESFGNNCLVNQCKLTYNINEADVLIFPNAEVIKKQINRRRIDQIWIAYLLESPNHTFDKRFPRLNRGKEEFNWTASYKSNSDIVTPYAKFVTYLNDNNYRSTDSMDDKSLIEKIYEESSDLHKSIIRKKTKKVAWFASNCYAANNRLEYALELSKYIQVDIYGRCGNFDCDKWNQTGCLEMLNREYKFYLSFENSNSQEYITEKLYRNALGNNDLNHLVLPIVMGPSKKDYISQAPSHSFIHVDDFDSASQLADYLKLLDSNDALYYSYFNWKTTGRFVDTKFMCRVCALMHETALSGKTKSYPNIIEWFNDEK